MDKPETIAAELRTIARANVADLDGFEAEDTIEWDAAGRLETAARALREIQRGAKDPRAIATVALFAIGDSVTAAE